MLTNWKKKLVAMLLIFTLTFSNFAIVGKTYASSIFGGIFGNEDTSDTGNSNVEFDAYFFDAQSNQSKDLESDVNTEDLNLGLTVKVLKNGYLKDAKIILGNGEEVNFKIIDDQKVEMVNNLQDDSDVIDEESVNNEVIDETELSNEVNNEAINNVTNNVSNEVDSVNEVNTNTTRPVSNEAVIRTHSATNEVSANETEVANEVSNEVTNNITNEENITNETEQIEDQLEDEEETTNINNFEEFVQNDENVQAFDGKTLELTQLNAGSEVEINFPIRYENSEYVDASNLSKSNKIRFEGIYMNNDGEEVEVSKDVDLKLTWTDSRNIKIDSEVTKYIGYSMDGVSGLILQTSVKIDNTTTAKSLPVKNSKVSIEVPNMNGKLPETINVVAKSLKGVNGKQNDEIVFGNDNWSYDSEKNQLIIKVKNEKELMTIQNENEVLKDENAPEKELYYSGSGEDEYIITYTYNDVSADATQFSSLINAEYGVFNGDALNIEEQVNYEVTEQVGDIVNFSMESLLEDISKGYTYLNYNNENSVYEVEIENKLIFNISYKDIVDGLYYEDSNTSYITKAGEAFANNDLYYKRLSVSKSSFEEFLSADGYIDIYDANGNLLIEINKEMETNENGLYEIVFDGSIRGIRIETSKPISEGNLVINAVRAYSNVSYEKNDYKNFDRISMNAVGRAKYIYLDNYADCGTGTAEVILSDTTTKANLEIGQDNLSTLTMNNAVELKIVLNNENITSDIYGDSQFEIKMPEYVTSVEITDSSIVYGEGLELSNVVAYENNNDLYIRAEVTGKQNQLSSGIVSKGTNIVINANIELDLFTPATEGKFELKYINNEVTSYKKEMDGVGYDSKTITYSAPKGVVSVNSILNYDDNGNSVASVNQGKVLGNLDIYSNSRNARMVLTVMNNEPNMVSNIKILGRMPKEGITDIQSDHKLGTTIDTRIISGIVPDAQNNADFRIYYSENPSATNDLNDSANGWVENVDNFDNIYSYLIVPVDDSYTMESSQKIRFSYEFEIPGNLTHNQEIYGAFGTYYTNNSSEATIDRFSVADLVGLTTGVGPELSINTTLSNTEMKEFEELEITTKVKNVGKEIAREVKVEVPLPKYTSFKSYTTGNENVVANTDGTPLVYELEELKIGEEVEIRTNVLVDKVNQATDDNLNFDVVTSVTADELDVLMQTAPQTVTLKQAEMKVSIIDSTEGVVMQNGDEFKVFINISDLKTENLKDIEAILKLDDSFEYKSAFARDFTEDGTSTVEGAPAEWDANSRTVTWKCDEVDLYHAKTLELDLVTKELAGDVTKKDTKFIANVKADGTDEYESEIHVIPVGKPSLTIVQTSSTTNSYVKEGGTINYSFAIKNEGSAVAKSVSLEDKVPQGLVVKKVSYGVGNTDIERTLSEKDKVEIGVVIHPQETLNVDLEAKAVSLQGAQELSVTNSGTVQGENIAQVKSNDITHIVEASEKPSSSMGDVSTGPASSSITEETSSSFSKTYKITGTAWLDANKDGVRTSDEQLMKGVKATLVNSDEGVIKQTVATNSKGEYAFNGVARGNYIIIFDYDTVLYTVTTYQKQNVTSNVNSDVITTKVEQDGVLRNAAVTDVIAISGGSISNIDIGLAEALKFDLALNVGITNITVQNSQGTVTKPYSGDTLTKTEVGAKQMVGTEIYIEYTFTVKNEGEIAGMAKKVVDYIPENMNFNSGMNKEWYTGADGNLYTTTLANTEIKPGETKTFKLVLSRTMTEDNTGTVSNTAEIAEDYNIYGVSDLDSTPANKAQKEDDFGRADSLLSVRTGEVFIYISVIITTIILVGVAVFIVVLKMKYRVERGGVQ